ncbi:MAG: hypothetical protein LBU09_02030, partial [Endomicrobium sp.]|nr:hypothetical protein [Endomicrobium sp.]
MLSLFKGTKIKKITAAVTTLSFVFSIFAQSGFAAPSALTGSSQAAAQAIPVSSASDNIVPFNIGRITDFFNAGGDKVIVNIQDLHAHEETQRNINNILAFLDSRYGIENIYIEGAVGNADTSWLSDIKDGEIGKAVIERLIRDGKLTGAEYYAVTHSKNLILKGIENEKLYLENFKRLGQIYKEREEISLSMLSVTATYKEAAAAYYSRENREFLKRYDRYKNGSYPSDKFFRYLMSRAQKAGVNFANYPVIVSFAELIKTQNRLDASKINSQIAKFLEDLKNELSFKEYKKLSDMMGAPEKEGSLYLALSQVYDEKGYGKKYPALKEFFDFINLNQNINPIDLLSEENLIVKDITYKFSKSPAEREVISLGFLLSLFDGYLNNKITAKDYSFLSQNKDVLNGLWKKYVSAAGLAQIEKYEKLFNDFYTVNIERNRHFLKTIGGELPPPAIQKVRLIEPSSRKLAQDLLKDAKNIDIVITGGFHTNDLAKLMGDNGYSYVVITPNVTQSAVLADKLYDADFLSQLPIFESSFQKAVEAGILNFNTEKPIEALAGFTASFSVIDEIIRKMAEQNKDARAEDILNALPQYYNEQILTNKVNNENLKSRHGIENIKMVSVEKNSDGSYKAAFSYEQKGQSKETVWTANSQTEGQLNYNPKERRNIALIVGSLFFAAATIFVSLPLLALGAPIAAVAASFAIGALGAVAVNFETHAITKIFEEAAGWAENGIFKQYGIEEPSAEELVKFLSDYEQDLKDTQRDYLDNEYGSRGLPENVKLVDYKVSGGQDALRNLTFSYVNEEEPNVIYVDAKALYFLVKQQEKYGGRGADLARSVIADHEYEHLTRISQGSARGKWFEETRIFIKDLRGFKRFFAANEKKVIGDNIRRADAWTSDANVRFSDYKSAALDKPELSYNSSQALSFYKNGLDLFKFVHNKRGAIRDNPSLIRSVE